MRIGVLALQGAFIEHINMLEKLGQEAFEIRNCNDLTGGFDAIILPGGESTVIGKLLAELNMIDIIKEKILHGMPVLGTCAGMILLAKKIEGNEKTYFATMDITVKRNAYGRQMGSFYTDDYFNGAITEMRFIRAPYVSECGKNIEVLSAVDDKTVAVRHGNQLAVAFHPELTADTSVHEYFLQMVRLYLS
ncbi:MAG: pyridoxal 5'-phosphate synthase glutaminase subunit PdxT [Oscillospiraceae bacterium]